MEARSHIRKNKNDTKSVSDKITEIKKMKSTSGFLNSVTQLGKGFYSQVNYPVDEVTKKKQKFAAI